MPLTYFGDQADNTDDSGSPSITMWTLFTAPISGQIGELSAKLWNWTGTTTVRLAVYDSTGTTLICQGSASVTVTGASPGSWFGHLTQADMTPNTASLVGGTTYLLVFSGTNLGLRYDSTTGDSPDTQFNLISYAAGGFPVSLPSPTSAGNTYSVRCGLIAGGGGGSDAGMGGQIKRFPIRQRPFAPGLAR